MVDARVERLDVKALGGGDHTPQDVGVVAREGRCIVTVGDHGHTIDLQMVDLASACPRRCPSLEIPSIHVAFLESTEFSTLLPVGRALVDEQREPLTASLAKPPFTCR